MMTSIAPQRIRVVAKIRASKPGPNLWVLVNRPKEGGFGRVRVEFKDLSNGSIIVLAVVCFSFVVIGGVLFFRF
ncbi:hypothetical protein Droror1_Dr00025231, partial [Drosera rotundifolia]